MMLMRVQGLDQEESNGRRRERTEVCTMIVNNKRIRMEIDSPTGLLLWQPRTPRAKGA